MQTSLRVYIWVQVGGFVRMRSYFSCSLVFLLFARISLVRSYFSCSLVFLRVLVLGWDSTTAVTVDSGGSFGVLEFIRRAFHLWRGGAFGWEFWDEVRRGRPSRKIFLRDYPTWMFIKVDCQRECEVLPVSTCQLVEWRGAVERSGTFVGISPGTICSDSISAALNLILWLERPPPLCSQLQWVRFFTNSNTVTLISIYLQGQAQSAPFSPYFPIVQEPNPWLSSAWFSSFSTSSFTAPSSLSWLSNISAIQIDGHPFCETQRPACTQDASLWALSH